MSSEPPSLVSYARSKLHLAVGSGSKDKCSLHRWVLLKNSITRSQPSIVPSCNSNSMADVNLVYNTDVGEVEVEDEDVCSEEEHDSFMFPDAGRLVHQSRSSDADGSESQWLDSLLETLGEEDEDEYDSDVHPSLMHGDDEDEPPFTPSTSPMSSSDDLTIHPVYFDPPISMPYPIVYPPYHSQFIPALEFGPLNSPLDSSYPPLNVALPYYDADDVDDLPVPDAIEDESDDESDALSTPSNSRSISSFVEPSTPQSRQRPLPQVYVDSDDSYFYPFELDPLPFPDDHRTSPLVFNNAYHQEC
ncbi:hypothetical protein EW146_g5657 [Bondarzewia mesenterica]|uniref:Uncharacterized protein n=1 Tax=Bondarzewia mesenterica TaxID=1095465 RepID=A0A4S4LSW4_9AGAM|nr:hypothetical protein EW146_g5657 [Bondarzewia mesenterica]